MKITFEGNTVKEIKTEMRNFLNDTADHREEKAKVETVTEEIKPTKKTAKPKKEEPTPVEEAVEAEELPEDLSESVEELKEEKAATLEDVMDKARAYLTRAAATSDMEKAKTKVRNILSKYNVKSVRELEPKDFDKAIRDFS